MYTNQPYQQYPPAAANNPYADNPKLLKQVFTRPSAIGVIVSLGVILTVMLYQFISFISSYASINNSLNSFGSYASSQVAAVRMTFGMVIAIYVIVIAVYLLPFIGFIIMYSKSKNLSDSSSPRAGITLNQVFATISLTMTSLLTLFVVFGLFIFISANMELQSSSRYYSSSSANNFGTGLFVMFLLLAFCVVMIIWSSNAIRSCSAMKRTLDGQGLFINGITPFCVCTIISVIILGLLLVLNIIGVFGTAVIANSSSDQIIRSLSSSFSLNTIISFISSIAVIMLNIFLFAFASAYKKAVNASHYSIAYNGTNIYTANTSNATAYYQSTYQGPQDNMSNPPYNVQNSQQINTYYANPQPTANQNNQLNLNKTPVQNTPNIQPQSTENVCSACGAKNKADSLFCQNCGSVLKSAQAQQSANNSNTPINLNKNTAQNNLSNQPQSTENICSACGAKNKADSLFCQNCGNSLKSAQAQQSNAQINLTKAPVQSTETICSACGAKNKADSLFCQNCGTRLR